MKRTCLINIHIELTKPAAFHIADALEEKTNNHFHIEDFLKMILIDELESFGLEKMEDIKGVNVIIKDTEK